MYPETYRGVCTTWIPRDVFHTSAVRLALSSFAITGAYLRDTHRQCRARRTLAKTPPSLSADRTVSGRRQCLNRSGTFRCRWRNGNVRPAACLLSARSRSAENTNRENRRRSADKSYKSRALGLHVG